MKPQEVTLHSGGARGAEAAFGAAAQACGVTEINYTFEGHHIERTVGTRELTDAELTTSDMVMTEVSRRFKRDYSTRPWMRRILQSLCHQVNNGYQVFVIGAIQDDRSVKGGTGWAAELAKLFNRPLHVFDQEQGKWFSWLGGDWVENEPAITHFNICGTGTRNLNDAGAKAIAELFARSFNK